jgi:hypothetical protein
MKEEMMMGTPFFFLFFKINFLYNGGKNSAISIFGNIIENECM